MRIIKTDVDGYIKDLDSGAVLSSNDKARDQYRKRRAAAREADEQREMNEARLNKVETDLSEIKDLLLQILQKK